MSGLIKKVKKKADRLADRMLPGSHSPSPTPEPAPTPPIPAVGTHAYAEPQDQQSIGATAGSVVYELLAAARDGSDLCLPLKAALVGVVKIWDI